MSSSYGLQLSLLQLVRVHIMLTHNDEPLPVSLEEQAVALEGKRVTKVGTARQTCEMMVAVTGPGSTGTADAVDGFDVGAKTGTAHKLINGHYVDNEHVVTSVGFVLAQNPRVIVTVTVDESTVNDYYGGAIVGPVSKQVMNGSLSILDVSSTKPLKEAATVKVSP